ncbi:hypothetical protein Ddc_13070 [Ditylenchus destructor]|nr:hypothetical protein Ddc_13070 [Ditylenchus destructor]
MFLFFIVKVSCERSFMRSECGIEWKRDKHKLEIKARTGESGPLSSLGHAFVNMETAPQRKNFSTGQKVRQAIEAQQFPSLAGKTWTIHDNANKLIEDHTEVYITPIGNYMTVEIED